MSLSARRAWIEIARKVFVALIPDVALRKESVDRNTKTVALEDPESDVALRKESVDRNFKRLFGIHEEKESLSARRAWIEISLLVKLRTWKMRRSPQGERG